MTEPGISRADWAPALAAAILLILVACLLGWAGAPRTQRAPAPIVAALPLGTPPRVEPERLIPARPEEAQAINAATPFTLRPIVAARPFRFRGDGAEHERALTCLAAAVWYEAGDDRQGQEAVAQVVLNRLRHPAFPKTVCGVVFQGADLRTGCQFTFTCDGALRRVPPPAAWARARSTADWALEGGVFAPVGYATHYHTDWVIPAWSGALDKLAVVGTHLFFGWRGWWGEAASFTGRQQSGERLDARILALADSTRLPAGEAEAALPVSSEVPQLAAGSRIVLSDLATGVFVVALPRSAAPEGYRTAATQLCAAREQCLVAGWFDGDQSVTRLPLPRTALRTAVFLYRANRRAGNVQALWNCGRIKLADQEACMPGTEGDRGVPAAAPAGVAAAP